MPQESSLKFGQPEIDACNRAGGSVSRLDAERFRAGDAA